MTLLSQKAKTITDQYCAQCELETRAVKAVLVPFHSRLTAVSGKFWDMELLGWLIPACQACYSDFETLVGSIDAESRFEVITKWLAPLMNKPFLN